MGPAKAFHAWLTLNWPSLPDIAIQERRGTAALCNWPPGMVISVQSPWWAAIALSLLTIQTGRWAYSPTVPRLVYVLSHQWKQAFMDLILVRFLFVALLSGVCYFLHPFGVTGWAGAAGGALAAVAVIVFELRVRALSLRRLIGAVAGSVLGIFGAALFCLVLRSAPLSPVDVGGAADLCAAADDLCGPACWCEQRRSAEPGCARHAVCQRSAHAKRARRYWIPA